MTVLSHTPPPPSTPPSRLTVLAALAFLAGLTPALAGQEHDGSCATCHANVAALEAGQAHARAGIGCTACHGGDASKSTREAAKAEGTGYKGALAGVALVTTCGDCHASVETMNAYGLPTDQLAQYRTSKHGQALFEKGDPNVATCASCHGAHGIAGPGSSDSPVAPAHVAETCGRCHGDPGHMKPYSLDTDIPADWGRSVHASLLAKGDLSAPQCATCHGSHGAVPPGFRTVAAVCGKCHVREKELFAQSPHAAPTEEGDFPGCEACHGNHEVRPAGPEILERMCTLCHTGEEEPLGTRDAILASLRTSSQQLASTRETLRNAEARGLVTEDDRLRLDEAATALEGARVVQHGLDAAALAKSVEEAEQSLRQLTADVSAEGERRRLKRLSVLPVVAFLMVMSFGFWVRQRRIHRRSHRISRGVPHA